MKDLPADFDLPAPIIYTWKVITNQNVFLMETALNHWADQGWDLVTILEQEGSDSYNPSRLFTLVFSRIKK